MRPLNYLFIAALLLECMLVHSQAGDISFTVRKPVEIGLSPGISTIFNDTVYTFAITGMKKGMVAQATMTNCYVVKVPDTMLIIRANFKPKTGTGYDTAKARLKITFTDKTNRNIPPLEKTFAVLVRQITPDFVVIPLGNSSMRYGIYLEKLRIFSGPNRTSTTGSPLGLLSSPLSDSTERRFRKYYHLEFWYVDSTTNGSQMSYRAIDLAIPYPGITMSYSTAGPMMSNEMRKAIRKLKGKREYTFILHKSYVKGDKTRQDRVDKVTYTPAKSDGM
jgi:hypothetical protein